MANVPIFPHFLDPLQRATPLELLGLAKLHLLLFDSLVIQDNFLISKVLADVKEGDSKRSLFCDWIERGWLKVALREGSYSLADLKKQLYQKAVTGGYVPFEDLDDGIQLYRSRPFNAYLQEIDTCLSTEGAVLGWDSVELGQRLRGLMKHSAQDGSSGLPVERAVRIWNQVDQIVSGSGHSRTMYYRCAAQLSEVEADVVRRWVGLQYLSNLPHYLGLGVSVPRKKLTLVSTVDPMAELADTKAAADPEIIRGRECALLNSRFLSGLSLDDIERLRKLPEFNRLAEARVSGDPGALKRSLLAYLQALGEAGPRISNPRIRALEAQLRVKEIVSGATAILGVIVGVLNLPAGIALAASSIFLQLVHGTDNQLRNRQRQAVVDLELQRSQPLFDFCHDGNAAQFRTVPPNSGLEPTADVRRKRRGSPRGG